MPPNGPSVLYVQVSHLYPKCPGVPKGPCVSNGPYVSCVPYVQCVPNLPCVRMPCVSKMSHVSNKNPKALQIMMENISAMPI